MRRLMAVVALGLALVVPATAQACQMPAPRDLQRATQADVVVVGRIVDYRLVRDEAGRRMNREMLARDPELAEAIGKAPGSLMTDYALFDVRVKATLWGEAPRRLRVRLDSAGPRPPRLDIPYLIVLNAPKPGAEAVFTVVNQTCAGAFLFPEGEPDALTIRRLLTGEPPATPERHERAAEPDVPVAAAAPPVKSASRMDWSETPRLYRVMLGAALAGLLIALLVAVWRRRRGR